MENIFSFENPISFLAKIGIIVFLIVYIIFSFAVSKQVKIMTDTLEVGFETQIKSLAFIHVALSIAVLLIAIIIL